MALGAALAETLSTFAACDDEVLVRYARMQEQKQ